MGRLREEAGDILDSALKNSGITGAMIATRAGLPALGRTTTGDSDVIVAMAAASLAAAETTAREAGAGAVDEVIAKCGSSEVHICALDEEHLLIVIMRDAADSAALDAARQQLQDGLAD
jgi:predicted regulator of Ras-like GTPase activity (Roadblock/LC7/MglB family)